MYPVELTEPMIAFIIYLLESAPSISGTWNRFYSDMAVAFLPEEMLDRKDELISNLSYLDKTVSDAGDAGVFNLTRGTRYTLVVNLQHPSVAEVSGKIKARRVAGGNLAVEIRERLGRVLPPPKDRLKSRRSAVLTFQEEISFFVHCKGGSIREDEATSDMAVYLTSRSHNATRTKVGEHLRKMERSGQIVRTLEGNRIVGVDLVYEHPKVKKALAKACA